MAGLPVAEAGPAPLIGVAVPVTQIDVHQAGGEVGARIHPIIGALAQLLEQPLGADDVGRAGEARRVVGLLRPLLDRPQHPAELRRELAQPGRVWRHDHQARLGMEDAGGLEDRGHDERPRGVRRAGLVAHDVGRGGLAQLGGQRPGGILVHRAEAVLLAVGAHEAERLGLLAAAAPSGPEAAGERGQVEHRNVDRGRPELPIAGTEEEAVEDPGLVLGPRRHPHRRARDERVLPRRLGRDLERSQREREHERRPGGDQWTQGHPTGLRHGDSERDSGQRYERAGEAASSAIVTFCNTNAEVCISRTCPSPAFPS